MEKTFRLSSDVVRYPGEGDQSNAVLILEHCKDDSWLFEPHSDNRDPSLLKNGKIVKSELTEALSLLCDIISMYCKKDAPTLTIHMKSSYVTPVDIIEHSMALANMVRRGVCRVD